MSEGIDDMVTKTRPIAEGGKHMSRQVELVAMRVRIIRSHRKGEYKVQHKNAKRQQKLQTFRRRRRYRVDSSRCCHLLIMIHSDRMLELRNSLELDLCRIFPLHHRLLGKHPRETTLSRHYFLSSSKH